MAQEDRVIDVPIEIHNFYSRGRKVLKSRIKEIHRNLKNIFVDIQIMWT